MKERVVIGAFIFAALLGTGMVRAHADGTVVLTPTVLYDKIEKLEEKHSKVLSVLLKHNRRLNELERKVAGMQKQITILHAKKADAELRH